MTGFLAEISLILVFATLLSLILRFFKLPSLLAYILTGILLTQFGAFNITSQTELAVFSKIGIALLLFTLGLDLKLGELKSVGKTAIITGVGQILFTTVIGILLSSILGFGITEAVFIAIALTFSSTIMIVKLLNDKKDLNSLYGKIAVGVLLVQDFVAIIALIILTAISNGGSPSFADLLFLLLKTILIFVLIVFLSNFLFPRIIHIFSKSQEMLLIFSLAWAFSFAAIASSSAVGLSIEIGGFLAGLALANSVESLQVASKIRPIRDFFIVIFFVTLGLSMNLSDISSVVLPGIIFSVYVLIGNPIIVMTILGFLGYRKRTGFLAGLTVAQISEFSLILIALGVSTGKLDSKISSIITFVGIITFSASSYMIINGHRLYNVLQKPLGVFQRKNVVEDDFDINSESLENHIVIAGVHRIGKTLVESLSKLEENVIALDFDPDVIQKLQKKGYKVFFGDITDYDIQEKLKLSTAKMIFSTVPDVEDNVTMITAVKSKNANVKIIVIAQNNEDIETYYKNGADFVVSPFIVTAKLISKLIKENTIENIELLNEYIK